MLRKHLSLPENSPAILAQSLSWALHPIVLPLYLVAALFSMTSFALFPSGMRLYLCGSVLLFGTALPAFLIGLLYRTGRLKDLRIDERRQRILPLVIGTLCYLLCALLIARVGQALFLRKIVLAAGCCEAMCCLVTLRWKISLHLTGMGAAVALFAVMNIIGIRVMFRPLLIAILASGLLASARLYLGRHEPRPLLAGFCGGGAIMLLVLLFC